MKQCSLVQAALLGIVIVPCAPALAAEKTTTLAGAGLAIVTPCAAQVVVQPDPNLQGRSVVTATADHPEELDRLVLDTEPSPSVSTGRRECWRPESNVVFRPTLSLRVKVPVGTPLSIDESAVGHYTIGDVGGPFSLNLSGAAQVQTGRITTLRADLSGSGSLTASVIDGPASAEMSGHGMVRIGRATAPVLSLSLSGMGSFVIMSGSISKATLDNSGAGTVQIGATVGDVTANLSGIGSVHLSHVTGAVQKEVSGMGSVTVGD